MLALKPSTQARSLYTVSSINPERPTLCLLLGTGLPLVWTPTGETTVGRSLELFRCPYKAGAGHRFKLPPVDFHCIRWCRTLMPESAISSSAIRSWSGPCHLPDLVSSHFRLSLAPATLASFLFFLNKPSTSLARVCGALQICSLESSSHIFTGLSVAPPLLKSAP